MNIKNKLNIKTHFLYRRSVDRVLLSNGSNCHLPKLELDDIAQNYGVAIVYAGLRSIAAPSVAQAFNKINDGLANIESLYFPGFTPSFRKTGVYSMPFSKPEVGAFSKYAWSFGFERTFDPLHSLFLAQGKINKKNVFDDTFHPDGIFKLFLEKDACIINIGTPSIVSTSLHYIERLLNVPYLDTAIYDGVIYDKHSIPKQVEHRSYKYTLPVVWNRKKIENLWSQNGCMVTGCWNGSICRIIDGRKSFELLSREIKNNPYFLVTF